MRRPIEIVQARDSAKSWVVFLTSETGDALTYTSGDAVSALLWAGDDRASTAVTAAWQTAPDKVRVTITSAQVGSLDPGKYRLRVYVGSGTSQRHAAEAVLTLLDGPGTSTAPATYCTAEDVRQLLPRLDDYSDPDTDQTGFAEQRAVARQWLDAIIMAKFPHDLMRTYLTDNRLIVTPQVRYACATYTLALLYRRNPAKADTAMALTAEAEASATALIISIDTVLTNAPLGVVRAQR